MKIDKYDHPDDLLYYIADPGHIWIRRLENSVQIGADDFSQDLAGDISFVRVKKEGKKVTKGGTVGTFETAKWVGPMKSPVDGTILARNPEVAEKPEIINERPYDAWIAEIAVENLDEQLADPLIVPVGDKLREYILSQITKYRDTLE
ncbi:MAG: glycine cleavage system protein H [Candidatus Heimdallarchaeota archaeon]